MNEKHEWKNLRRHLRIDCSFVAKVRLNEMDEK